MHETHDFGRMARSTTGFIRVDAESRLALELNIIDLLRQVWNARGAADIAKLEIELSSMLGATGLAVGNVSMKALDRTLRTLDR